MELPEVGAKLKQGQSFGTIESVKAVSELYAPLSGEVVDVNTGLKDKPEAVNKDAHVSWMIVIRLTNTGEASALLDAAQYQALIAYPSECHYSKSNVSSPATSVPTKPN